MKNLWEAKIINGYRAKGKRYDPVKGHTGIDLDYKFESFPAPCDITILMNNVQPQMGKVIYAKDDEDLIHVYAHLTSFMHEKGDKVYKGQLLTISGNTGTATSGAHLHFELLAKSGTNPKMERKLLPFKGDNIDPATYLSKWKRGGPKNEASGSTGGWIGSLLKRIPFPSWLSHKK